MIAGVKISMPQARETLNKFEIRNQKFESRFPNGRSNTNAGVSPAKSFEFLISNFEFLFAIPVVDKWGSHGVESFVMSTPTSQQLRVALSKDLNKSGAKPPTEVVDDVARKTFTANKDGAVLEFAHKQPDTGYWNGVKHYGSGKQSRIRLPRTQPEPAQKS